MRTPDNIASQMLEKTNGQLLEMFDHPQDWVPEALHLASEELRRRGVAAPVVRPSVQVPRVRGAFSIGGIGTAFYGKRDFRPNSTYITTEWVTYAYIPLIPLRSLRVRYEGPSEFGSGERYSVYERTAPNGKQVFYTYGFVTFVVAWLLVVIWIAVSIKDGALALAVAALGTLLPTPIPWALRKYARQNPRT